MVILPIATYTSRIKYSYNSANRPITYAVEFFLNTFVASLALNVLLKLKAFTDDRTHESPFFFSFTLSCSQPNAVHPQKQIVCHICEAYIQIHNALNIAILEIRTQHASQHGSCARLQTTFCYREWQLSEFVLCETSTKLAP